MYICITYLPTCLSYYLFIDKNLKHLFKVVNLCRLFNSDISKKMNLKEKIKEVYFISCNHLLNIRKFNEPILTSTEQQSIS